MIWRNGKKLLFGLVLISFSVCCCFSEGYSVDPGELAAVLTEIADQMDQGLEQIRTGLEEIQEGQVVLEQGLELQKSELEASMLEQDRLNQELVQSNQRLAACENSLRIWKIILAISTGINLAAVGVIALLR